LGYADPLPVGGWEGEAVTGDTPLGGCSTAGLGGRREIRPQVQLAHTLP
jgi:hypothetical protein